jgi:hypothetical protein
MSKLGKTHGESERKCPDCGARPGEYHELGCDAERCPYCGGQLLACLMCEGCPELGDRRPWPPPLDDRTPWAGEGPGTEECRELGWYVSGEGPCGPGDPGATPGLHRPRDGGAFQERCVRTDFFNRERYLNRPQCPTECCGCGQPWDRCASSPELRRKFRGMTGLRWPEEPIIYPLTKDFKTLGLDTSQVPARLSLCLGCAIEYMEAFNRLNAQRRRKHTG